MVDNENLKDNETIINSEIEENVNDMVVEEEIKLEEEVVTKEPKKIVIIFKKLLAGVIDQIITIAIALLLLMVFDLILRLVGFYIVEREPMFLVMYIISNIIYTPICESLKIKKTIGRKILFK
ncbi:hypothetical protein JCM1393_17830 [Clostridium carnis]